MAWHLKYVLKTRSVSKKLHELSTHEPSCLSTAMKYLPSRHDDPLASQKTFMALVLSKIKHTRVRERLHNELRQIYTLHFNEVTTEIETNTTYQSQTCQSSSVLLTCSWAQNICFH